MVAVAANATGIDAIENALRDAIEDKLLDPLVALTKDQYNELIFYWWLYEKEAEQLCGRLKDYALSLDVKPNVIRRLEMSEIRALIAGFATAKGIEPPTDDDIEMIRNVVSQTLAAGLGPFEQLGLDARRILGRFFATRPDDADIFADWVFAEARARGWAETRIKGISFQSFKRMAKAEKARHAENVEFVEKIARFDAERKTREQRHRITTHAKPEAPAGDELPLAVSYDDFLAYSPTGNFIFKPTAQLWPAEVINKRLPWVDNGPDKPLTSPATWLTKYHPVEQMTWWPGEPPIIRHRLVIEAGVIDHKDASIFNQYRRPTIELGDPEKATPWLDLGRTLWPDDIDHLVAHCAFMRQHPEEKVNHAEVLGGAPGIGKDTWLEAVAQAVGEWNVADIGPVEFLGRFNGFAKSVLLRISEARSSEKFNRFDLFDHMKTYAAAPPKTKRIDEKNTREYYVMNLCHPFITLNDLGALHLPPEDRRHHVAWSEVRPEHFGATKAEREAHWNRFWAWYRDGGFNHVAAYLATYDLSHFDPKAPPPKTAGFWRIVDAARAPEEAELADALDKIGNPAITTLAEIQRVASMDFSEWLRDRRNRRVIAHRFKGAGYLSVRNPNAKDGLWKVDNVRQVIYGRHEIEQRGLLREAGALHAQGIDTYAKARSTGCPF